MTEVWVVNSHPLFNDPVLAAILTRLKQRLNPSLTYHSVTHTVDVLSQTLTLAEMDAVDKHSKLILAIAAAFHDAGFLTQRVGHEKAGAMMAAEALTQDSRFTTTDIALVQNIIMDTQIRTEGAVHRCTTPLSPWLLDADLANFGRSDFFEQTELVAQENQTDAIEALLSVTDLMDRHVWLSNAGRSCFATQKAKNRRLLTQRLS